MSDYWVSKKKYFCKYCDIYIADDAPSRQQHENGLRHKGNVERFIRGIYKAGEKHKKDLEEEKREMKRVEQAAAAAFAQDVGSGLAKAQAPIASTSAAPKKSAAKPTNPYANYSTAQSLGYTDPDAERIAAEIELRRSQGIAGEWEIITPPQARVDLVPPTSEPTETTVEAGVKREADAPLDEEDTRAFRLKRKKMAMGLGEIYDPGHLSIKIKKEESVEPPKAENAASTTIDTTIKQEDQSEDGSSSFTAEPSKWSKPQWSEPIPDLKQEERQKIFGSETQTTDEQKAEVKAEPDIKSEETQPLPEVPSYSGGSLFKKRKTPAGTNRRRDI
ncbi:hypothetical protein BDN70DRAFT_849610 [Pholiota conissans]|uniref:Matrin-type domain-containing protein n=1 Tax=Pholiota conissans TaxID=109636 RepID=A0A9P5ZBM4_9AGAR|nr:hypothetical protein BDN70DRAFT_849610 [Pholiota conissans]